ncbi:MAG: hypothetical protein NWP79_02305, partial [Paracoccaceae bacterium]|nr:hypothetical protein [Paracoccaceae bacterium]
NHINATSTPDQKNRTSTHKRAATGSRVQRSATRRHPEQVTALNAYRFASGHAKNPVAKSNPDHFQPSL